MPPISSKNVEFWIQKQASAGTALETAMRRFAGLKVTAGYNTTQDPFQAQGSRATDALTKNTELGAHTIESIQDYNALQLLLDSLKGYATPAHPAGATIAWERTWTLLPTGIITPAVYTGIYGVAGTASKLVDFVFNALGLTINRGQVGITTSAISRKPETGATKPTEGVTHKYVPAAPIPSRTYSVYLDNAAADYGTTKMLAAYDGAIAIGDTWGPDWTINAALPSYNALVENESVDHTASLTLGMGSEAVAHLGEWDAGTMKYLRFESIGKEIEDGVSETLRIDLPIIIESPAAYTTAPNSPTQVLPFNYRVGVDPVSGEMGEIYLVNIVGA